MGNASDAMQISAFGMRAQAARMRIISENIANADSTSREAGGEPYRRQVPVFEAELDRATGLNAVRMTDVAYDQSDFTLEFDPGHPAANAEGYVQTSNVQTLVEMMDMREAMRTYEANLNMIENARRMQERALDLLRR
ncbi:flagellar basal body rod protein FlgC [Maricaulis maris]|jgi:flagellar basal-body rod protein FlgC|uniref:flagellar basal body rod protein FlgC n=1 Tax=Maricaulis maris TaxID=74318 RepID=UPI00292031E3|nr:flagellar basal-body rod protein FlgC [Maricaulis maris]